MLSLGIESTAHTLGIGIVDDKGTVIANEKASFTSEDAGIKPMLAVNYHLTMFDFVMKRALDKLKAEGYSIKDIDVISFAQGPGIGACLRISAVAARTLSIKLNKPLIGVNHCIAHIEIGKQTSKFKDPITLYVSGANTQILAFASGRYRVFGETLDIGVGNFLDKFGRDLGLGFPAGPEIDKLAQKGGEKYIDLPYTIKGMDFSFGGILTKLKSLIDSKKYTKEDLCYSAQETVFAILTEATERAIAHIDKKEILLTGGVAANTRLQEMLSVMAKDREVDFAVVPISLAGDQGAMIAWAGLVEYKATKKGIEIKDSKINQNWRTDQVDITWI